MFGSSADELIIRATRLTADEIADLARATRKAMGVKVYLGLHPRYFKAHRAASAALGETGRDEKMRTGGPLAEEAVLTAAMAAATGAGRDTSGIGAAWQEFQRAVDSGNIQARKKAFRLTRKVFRRGLGRRLARQWPTAGIGVSWAHLALVTWDLATPHEPYTFDDRETLIRPWASVVTRPNP